MTATIQAIDVVVGYHARPVADAASFSIEAHRLTVVTGPNGSGKTTLLKTVAGLLPAIHGRVTPRLPHGVGGVVFVHSTPYLFAGTAGHNIELACRRDNQPELLAVLGLEQFRNRDVRRLSTGERQRVAIARALAAEPQLLVIDEPEGGLDAEGVATWRRILEQALQAGRPSIVIATHELAALDGLPLNVVPLPRGAATRRTPSS
jgi:ABC-type multidrug transport system ATPase subunit